MDVLGVNLLLSLKLLPLFGICIIATIPSWKSLQIFNVALTLTLINWMLSLFLWLCFDATNPDFQLGYHINSWTGGDFNFCFGFGVDGVNLWLIMLTTFLTPVCILVGWPTSHSVDLTLLNRFKTYCLIFLALELLLIAAFSARDLLVFYVFFEAVLIPMFLLLGIFGSSPRNVRAAYKMFLMTLVGSLPMLAGIWMVTFSVGSTNYNVLITSPLSDHRQMILWLLWCVSFAVKTPLIPLHGWLPETHTNAPTGGSIILAGILLKLGTYGFLRWSLPITPVACLYFSPIIYTLCLIGIVYVSLITLRQMDIKKIIAYSSVAHMSCCVLGLFAFNIIGLEGSLLMMVGHGIVSPGLFFCIGSLYDRFKTRNLYYYGGLAQTMPIFATAFLILTMANLSLPVISPTFAAEFLTLTGLWQVNKTFTVFAGLTVILTGFYSLFFFNRLCFGQSKTVFLGKQCDLNRREFAALLPFLILCFLIGINPNFVLSISHASIAKILLTY
jgi:proton-translocating NADH-quinone oxidoreductase chain M